MEVARTAGGAPAHAAAAIAQVLVAAGAAAALWIAAPGYAPERVALLLYLAAALAYLAARGRDGAPADVREPAALGPGPGLLLVGIYLALSLPAVRTTVAEGFVGRDWTRLADVLAHLEGRPPKSWLADLWSPRPGAPFAPGERALWGLVYAGFEENAPLYRAAALALHGLSGLLVALTAAALGGGRAVAAATGAFYVVHPVVGVQGSVDASLARGAAAALTFGAAYAHARARTRGRWGGVVAATALAGAALTLGPQGIAAPLWIFALELAAGGRWPGDRARWAALAPVGALAVTAGVYAVVAGLRFPSIVDAAGASERLRALPYALAVPVPSVPLGPEGDTIARGLLTAAFAFLALGALRARVRPALEAFAWVGALAAGLLVPWRGGTPPPAAVGGAALALASIAVPVAAGALRHGVRALEAAVVVLALAYLGDLGARPWHRAAVATADFADGFERLVPELAAGAEVVVFGLDADPAHGLDANSLRDAVRTRYLLFDRFELRLLGHSDRDPFVRGLLDPGALAWGVRDRVLEWDPDAGSLRSRTYALRRIVDERRAGAWEGADRIWDLERPDVAARFTWGVEDRGATEATAEGVAFDPSAVRFVAVEGVALPAASADEIRFDFLGGDPDVSTPARFELRWTSPGRAGWRGGLWSRRIDAAGAGHAVVFPVGRSIPWLLSGEIERLSLWIEGAPWTRWTLGRVEWIAPAGAEDPDEDPDEAPVDASEKE